MTKEANYVQRRGKDGVREAYDLGMCPGGPQNGFGDVERLWFVLCMRRDCPETARQLFKRWGEAAGFPEKWYELPMGFVDIDSWDTREGLHIPLTALRLLVIHALRIRIDGIPQLAYWLEGWENRLDYGPQEQIIPDTAAFRSPLEVYDHERYPVADFEPDYAERTGYTGTSGGIPNAFP